MRIALFGAGAVGSVLGACLHGAGEDVVLLARGEHLRALQRRGLRVRRVRENQEETYPIAATDDPGEAGPADFVILTVKAHALPEAAGALEPLLHQETAVVSTQNGIPWWYTQGLDEPWARQRLESVDPGGAVSSHVDFRRVIGSLVYLSCRVAEPGVVEHVGEDTVSLGEPDGSRSQRVRRLAEALERGGIRARVRSHLRQEIWIKLLGNASLNPISALTRASIAGILNHAEASRLAREVMSEVIAVASALGVEAPISPEKRLAGAEEIGEHRTSMLQDLEAGRPMELDAILGAVVELGGRVNVETPRLSALKALLGLIEAGRSV